MLLVGISSERVNEETVENGGEEGCYRLLNKSIHFFRAVDLNFGDKWKGIGEQEVFVC